MSATGDQSLRSLGNYAKDYPILYVDDEQDNCVVFEALFGSHFAVICATSPVEALRILARQPVAVLVTDQRMPGMSGIELCERVRDRYPSVIRLLVTAYSDHDTAVCAINAAGVSGYLVKPWDVKEVEQILRDSVGRAHYESLARQLRAALVDKERLSGLAATRAHILHDLGNIHVVVVDCSENLDAFARRLAGRVPAELLEELRSEIDELKAACDYIMALHGRTDSWHSPSEKTHHRVTDVFEAVRALVGNEVSPAAELVMDCSPEVFVWADRIDISRILVNLILNATRAIRDGGIGDGEIRVSARTNGPVVDFEVADNGPGIADSQRLRILEMLDEARPDVQRGFPGLGLAICRALAAANSGDITLVDPPGPRGERFHFIIPADEPDGEEAPR